MLTPAHFGAFGIHGWEILQMCEHARGDGKPTSLVNAGESQNSLGSWMFIPRNMVIN